MKIACPICKGKIIREQDEVLETIHVVYPDGNVKLIYERDNTHGSVYCSTDKGHILSDDVRNKALESIEKFERENK